VHHERILWSFREVGLLLFLESCDSVDVGRLLRSPWRARILSFFRLLRLPLPLAGVDTGLM
jgi:hypothetical protein